MAPDLSQSRRMDRAVRRRKGLRIGNRLFILAVVCISTVATLWTVAWAQQSTFRNAPESAAEMKNPYAGNAGAAAAGKKLYAQNCAQCHGRNQEGMGPAPGLDSATVRKAKPGELFWFITNGKPSSGMPAWTNLPKNQRWEIVSFLQENQGGAKQTGK